jgi:hypothetical protein
MTDLIKKNWFRNTLFALFQPFIPPSGFIPIIIHEAAHWISAVIIGIPITEIKLGWHSLGPGVSIPLSTPPESLPFFFYSGGITSATIILLLYVFYWMRLYYNISSSTNWIMSIIILFSFVIQLYIGLLEGNYYQDYPNYMNNYNLIIFIFALALIHAIVFFLLGRYKKFKNK